jgi:Tfp pilus assembly protein PilN
VKRFNYLAGPRQAAGDSKLGGVAIDNRIRVPVAAFIASVTLAAMLDLVQLTRLHAAQDRYSRASIRLAADEPAVRESGARRAHIRHETQLIDYVVGLQRTSLSRANDLAWIGNRLPAHTWLRAVRFENGNYTLDGTSDRSAAVGTALLALRDAGHATLPQLVSLHDDGGSTATRVRYTLRVETRP